MQSICVFCGSSKGNDTEFENAAMLLGAELARREIRLIYGGGKIGLMGAIANACLENGGRVVGVIPNFLAKKEIAHQSITELIKVKSMHERKLKMSQLADGFIALPGGYGTLEEFCEILTWVQLSLISKPIGLMNVNGFYDALISQFQIMADKELLKKSNLQFFVHSHDGETLLKKMMNLSTEVDSFKDKFIHT